MISFRLRNISLLLASLIGFSTVGYAKEVPVIKFKEASNQVETNLEEEHFSQSLRETKELTLCFRFIFKFYPSSLLFATKHFSVGFSDQQIYIFLKPWNVSAVTPEFRRVFKHCKPYILGYWVSMCISVKLHKTHQAVTLFQDGKVCAEHNYHDGNFDTMYFKKAISVKEL